MVSLISLTFVNIWIPPLNPFPREQEETTFFSSTFPVVLLNAGVQELEKQTRRATYLTIALTAKRTTVESRKSGVTRMWNKDSDAKAWAGCSGLSLVYAYVTKVCHIRKRACQDKHSWKRWTRRARKTFCSTKANNYIPQFTGNPTKLKGKVSSIKVKNILRTCQWFQEICMFKNEKIFFVKSKHSVL